MSLAPKVVKKRLASRDQVKTDINYLLADFFTKNIARSLQFDENYSYLWQTIENLSIAGGKRLRPYLLVLAYQGYGGDGYKSVLPVAAAQELLHLSLLIHDDIIDNDYIRYGQDNISGSMRKKYQQLGSTTDAAHYGDGAAILAGDLLISGAHNLIVSSELSDTQKLLGLTCLEEGIFTVGGGELLDMESVLYDFDDTNTLKIAELKTAGYSCVVPLITGASLAGAAEGEITLLRKLALALGIGFQLADDLLGIYGDEAVTGKSNLGDIREGKRTYLMSQALSRSSEKDRTVLRDLLGNPQVNQAQAEKIRAILEQSGAKAATHQKIREYASEANDLLQQLKLSTAAKQALQLFIKNATERSL